MLALSLVAFYDGAVEGAAEITSSTTTAKSSRQEQTYSQVAELHLKESHSTAQSSEFRDWQEMAHRERSTRVESSSLHATSVAYNTMVRSLDNAKK
jgi:hypothetical protein